MTDEETALPHSRTTRRLPDHPVRIALLDLIAEHGTLTSTQAAHLLGHSSGLCSFHLRQLARHGLIEEAPPTDGRARPWRLRWDEPAPAAAEDFDRLARDLEDTGYRRWLAHRPQAPAAWRKDDAFSAVLHLTPEEAAELAAAVRRLIAPYRERGPRPGTEPVAAVSRIFPLLAEAGDGERGRLGGAEGVGRAEGVGGADQDGEAGPAAG
ncbi:winged helix-turn-helix domain-containing protein [Kitasatospora sp. NPDC050543]|uniref:winged helix-turn-helix domain-containing protein n=1 Tax=Kitasatospora sp. NPDC050543 TaxID=3364054 RepID=UPI0037A4D1BC